MAENTSSAPRLSKKELVQKLKRVKPEPVLLPARILRRVIKYNYEKSGISIGIPRRRSFIVEREQLLEIVSPGELPVTIDQLEPLIVLVVEPERERLRGRSAQSILLFYWRHLFHALIELELRKAIEEGTLPPSAVREAIDDIGQTEFDEIRTVLQDENHLEPPRNNEEAYTEFVATYLELEHFSPVLLDYYFPSITDHAALRANLSKLVDSATLLERSRPEGAEAPDLTSQRELFASFSDGPEPPSPTPRTPSKEQAHRRTQAAEAAAKLGNSVRAAILHMQASRFEVTPGESRTRAEAQITQLSERLVKALGDPHDAQDWATALFPLLEPALVGLRSVESRLLYDLQRVCLDEEEEVFAVGVIPWALSFGRRPIKRALPSQREVLVYKHLRRAMKRTARLRVGEHATNGLRDLIRQAEHRAEHELRHAFREVLQKALVEVGLLPKNLIEEVAADKLVEELLDRVLERGFLTIGDLRDAISRNHLKLPNLNFTALWRGDALLRLNRALTSPLDGVYRPGEFYMRGLQRLSSLAFGTAVGRLLVLYLVLPIGGTFVILEGLQHTVGLLLEKTAGIHLAINASMVLIMGSVVLFGLLHSLTFRHAATRVFSAVGSGLKALIWVWPAAFFKLPWVRRVLDSRAMRAIGRYILQPAGITGLIALPFLMWSSIPLLPLLVGAGVLFLLINLLLNSSAGRALEEAGADWLIRNWEHIKRRVIPGFFRLIVDVFKAFLDNVERLLYTVDEWLRFRQGEPTLSLIIKGGLGFFWFFVTWILRFYVNLLIEPQVNPIKHFPVVTVAHKLMISFLPTIAGLLSAPLEPALGVVFAGTFGWTTATLLPGIAGFLVWEFKENWKLYNANRSRHLKPSLVGHHGETMLRFMKPGFHSGTLPKLYRKLRHAERRAIKNGDLRTFRRHQEALHHVSESVRHFVERELVRLLAARSLHLKVDAVTLGSNRIGLWISAPEIGKEPASLVFEEQSGWLVADFSDIPWLEALSEDQRKELRCAIGGLFKMSGVDIVRPQVRSFIEPPLHYDVADAGLLVWTEDYRFESRYPLEGETLKPELPEGAPEGLSRSLPELTAEQFFLSRRSLDYSHWTSLWEKNTRDLPGFADFALMGRKTEATAAEPRQGHP